ncbi:hypothetical protein ACFPN1_12550 [Lysobacter yangpyeongensis]|uniref:Phosphodiester glycosidase domain-containing protein n=1 Tax=Lysobacter yangpyeongensis TaxID=346182 RepID=A0ABW0SPT0_9GAMM
MLIALLLCAVHAPAWTREAPAPGCLDARRMSEARQADARTLAILQDDGAAFRLDLADACPDVIATDGRANLLAREGWVCTGAPAFVADSARRCAVTAVAPIDARAYAALARASHGDDGVTTLDAVTVKGERAHGFAGSPAYCVDPRWMRGWSEDPTGLLIEVSPKRAHGHRFYRIELGSSCPELANAVTVALHSGMGVGVVCGNAGDTVEVIPDAPGGGAPALFRGGLASRVQCQVAAVYPVDG